MSAQEEEGEDGDGPSGLAGTTHKLPLASTWHHFPPRYMEAGCGGLRDAHEEDPESILDEHVQRVLRTPGCQSPGPGRHSPDSLHVSKMSGVLGVTATGHSKHLPKSGAKHSHHHSHHSTARPKEQIEGEARRTQGSFPWGPDPHGAHLAKPRSHTENLGTVLGAGDSLAHR